MDINNSDWASIERFITAELKPVSTVKIEDFDIKKNEVPGLNTKMLSDHKFYDLDISKSVSDIPLDLPQGKISLLSTESGNLTENNFDFSPAPTDQAPTLGGEDPFPPSLQFAFYVAVGTFLAVGIILVSAGIYCLYRCLGAYISCRNSAFISSNEEVDIDSSPTAGLTIGVATDDGDNDEAAEISQMSLLGETEDEEESIEV